MADETPVPVDDEFDQSEERSGLSFDFSTFDLSLGDVGNEQAGFFTAGPTVGGVQFALPGGGVTGEIGDGLDFGLGPVDLSGDFAGLTSNELEASTEIDLAGDRQISLTAGREQDASGATANGSLAFEDGDLTRSLTLDDGTLSNRTAIDGESTDASFVDTLTKQVMSFTQSFTGGGSVKGGATHEAGDTGSFSLGGTVPVGGAELSASGSASTNGSFTGGVGVDAGPAGANLDFSAGATSQSVRLSANADLADDRSLQTGIDFGQSNGAPTLGANVSAEVIDDLTLSGKFDVKDGKESGSIGAELRRDDVAGDLELTAGAGGELGLSGEALVALHDRIFAGPMGSVDFDDKEGFLGGQVGFMPTDGLAVTLGGGFGTDGGTGRLQADLVGGGVGSAGELLENRQNASFGAFLEMGSSALDQFLGDAQESESIPGTDVRAGLTFQLPF
jgi:hypothetical protein